jgi:hypothetical protein
LAIFAKKTWIFLLEIGGFDEKKCQFFAKKLAFKVKKGGRKIS